MYMPKHFAQDFPGSAECAAKFLDEQRADPTPLPTESEWNEFYEFFGSVVFDPSSGVPQLFPGVVGIPEVLDTDKKAMEDALEKSLSLPLFWRPILVQGGRATKP
jgi:hypothetical protein